MNPVPEEQLINSVPEEQRLRAGGKRVQLFSAGSPAPLFIYHSTETEGNELWTACQKLGCPLFSLAVINEIKWNQEMSPWPYPPLYKREEPFTGGADAYLDRLNLEILPAVLAKLKAQPTYLALTGYSLAGLFALYALYKSNLFQRGASVSGSLWYPGLGKFVQGHPISQELQVIYFSLGDKESHTKNAILCQVEANTKMIQQYLAEQKIKTIFVSNSGNHFTDEVGRVAKSIKWLLEA